jgi:hypothetical protein
VAVDGSTSELPVTPDIIAAFELWGTKPLARLSLLFDVLNGVTLDAWIGPKSQGERACAAAHFRLVGAGDLVLLDRGYPAFWLFALLVQRGAHFCARMPLGVWESVDQFVATGHAEQIVTLTPGAAAKTECVQYAVPATPLRVRLVRIMLDTGEIEVLATTLGDTEAYPHAVFKELYHQRWPVEEDYKVVKLRAEVENWTGKSALSVRQDFYAKVFTANLTVILSLPAQVAVAQQNTRKRYAYRLNFAHALSTMKGLVVRLLRRTGVDALLADFWQVVARTIEPLRPGRQFPRPKGVRRKRFSMCYKSAR